MESSAADIVNPEREEQNEEQEKLNFITAKLILNGSLDDMDNAIIQEVEVPDLILQQLTNGIFAQFFDSVQQLNEKGEGSEQRTILIDARGSEEKGTKIKTKQMAITLASLIGYFSSKYESMARAFQTFKDFKEFLPLFNALGLNQKVDSEKLKEAVMKKDPILILIDVGGSILCRTSSKLAIDRRLKNNEYCQIKMHHQYYRPQFDHFLAQLLSHPRV